MSMTVDEILNSHRTLRPVVMGVLNITPDSFSDGGEFLAPTAAIEHAKDLIHQGTDILDVGGESTRPGSERVSPQQQMERLRDVLPAVAELGVPVSIDTTSAKVAEFALDAGAAIINDISAGRSDEEMLPLAGVRNAPIILMHMLGDPKSMQTDPQYDDVVAEVWNFLEERLEAARASGIPRNRCIVDPGIGFGKLLEHNLALLAGVGEFLTLGCPVLVGPSRKRFIGELTDQDDPHQRLPGALAASLAAWQCGASIFRVHDVRPLVEALQVAAAIESARADRETE
jgi:dihydropteroate synthase